MPVIIPAHVAKEKYPVRHGYKTASGNATRDCGDTVAKALRGRGLDEWLKIADENGVRSNLDAMIAAKKNAGQIRMALGRLLRARLMAHNEDPDNKPEPVLPEPTPAREPRERRLPPEGAELPERPFENDEDDQEVEYEEVEGEDDEDEANEPVPTPA